MAEGEKPEGKQPGGGREGSRPSADDILKQMAGSLPEEEGPEPKGPGAYDQLRQRLAAVTPHVREVRGRMKLPEVKAREAARRAQENVVGFIARRGTAARKAIEARFEKKELTFDKAGDVDRFLEKIGGGEVIPSGRAGGDVKASLAIGAAGAAGRRLAFETWGRTIGVVAPAAAILTGLRDLRTIWTGRGKGQTALAALSEKYTAERYGLLGKAASGVQVVERKVAARATRTESTALTDEVLEFVNGKLEEITRKGEDVTAYLSNQLKQDIRQVAKTPLAGIEAFGTLNRARIFNNYRDLERELDSKGLINIIDRSRLEIIRGVLYEEVKQEILYVYNSEGKDSARFKSLIAEVGRYQVGKKEYYGKVAAVMTASAGMSAVRSLVGLGIGEVFAEGGVALAEHFRAGGSIGFSIPGVGKISLGPAGVPEATEAPTEAPAVAAGETQTPTSTPTATGTPEPSPTATATATPTPTAEATPAPTATPLTTPAAEAVQPVAPPVAAAGEAIAPGTEDMPKGPLEAAAVEAEVQAPAEAQPEAPGAEAAPTEEAAAAAEAQEPFFHPQEGEYPWTTGAREGAEWAAESGLPDTIGVGNWALDPETAARNLGGWARAWEPDLTQKEGEELLGWFGRAMSWAQENPEEFRSFHIDPLSVAFNPAKLEAAMMAIEDPDIRRQVAVSMFSNGMIPEEHEASRKLLWEIIRGRR